MDGRAVGPRLRPVLSILLGLFVLLSANSIYLVGVTLAESLTRRVIQNRFTLSMFVVHLVLGAAIVGPALVFGVAHMRNTRRRANRRAVRAGYALFASTLMLLASGVLLTRLENVIEIRNPAVRSAAYWVHVAAPLVVLGLFVGHRRVGPAVRWRLGALGAAILAALVLGQAVLHLPGSEPVPPPAGESYFLPSLSRTVSGGFLPVERLMNGAFCAECHADVHARWASSAHRFSSFNNPAYLFSVRETRETAAEGDGGVVKTRFCAGCHDPVPFLSGAFDDPGFDEVSDPAASAGITCSVCHGIVGIDSTLGNGAYTLDVAATYPFAESERPSLRWLSRQLIRAKPAFHRKTYLKPFHRTAEFCSTCHKVHFPEELNDRRWLRGQNHYDSFLLSGVSGHGVASFYYPDRAETGCNGCHMPARSSGDLGAREIDESGALQVHDHLFPGANTAVPQLAGLDDESAAEAVDTHARFLEDSLRVDLFALREGGSPAGTLHAPLRPALPVLRPGGSYLLEVVVRSLSPGHAFTQGTTDSNEVWLAVDVSTEGREIGRSGFRSSGGTVDPGAHFLNAFMIDRDGYRIDRRNTQDIFVSLYDHQIPAGESDTVRYRIDLPEELSAPVTIEARVNYRKFDTTFMRHLYGRDHVNELPTVTIAGDRVRLPVSKAGPVAAGPPPAEAWERWNDYGVGLLRKPGRDELGRAELAFTQVERLGRPDGPLNRARVYLRDDRVVVEAPEALRIASAFDPAPPPWTLLWLRALVGRRHGRLEDAIADLERLLDGRFVEAEERGFDFSRDYRLINELGDALHEQARAATGERRRLLLERAASRFERSLTLDAENETAHLGLARIFDALGNPDRAEEHSRSAERYRVDETGHERALEAARVRYPRAARASEPGAIYELAAPPPSSLAHRKPQR